MTESPQSALDAQALEVLKTLATPRRRVRPRAARGLIDAESRQVVTAHGVIAAWRHGDGPAVLLVHGWEDDNALWGPAIDAFSAWGRPVVALDLPGHGFSPAEDASIGSAAAAVFETARQMGPIHAVIGHSYGCAAIIQALDHGLEASQAVLIATPTPRTRPRLPLDIPGVDPQVLSRADEIRQADAARQAQTTEAALRRMTVPMLAIHSLDDPQCPFANAERLVSLWPGAALMAVDGLGHRALAQDRDVLERLVMAVEQA